MSHKKVPIEDIEKIYRFSDPLYSRDLAPMANVSMVQYQKILLAVGIINQAEYNRYYELANAHYSMKIQEKLKDGYDCKHICEELKITKLDFDAFVDDGLSDRMDKETAVLALLVHFMEIIDTAIGAMRDKEVPIDQRLNSGKLVISTYQELMKQEPWETISVDVLPEHQSIEIRQQLKQLIENISK